MFLRPSVNISLDYPGTGIFSVVTPTSPRYNRVDLIYTLQSLWQVQVLV
jgi:hypothetical protein